MVLGRKRTPGLKWLAPDNSEQHRWAWEYLKAHGHAHHFEFLGRILPNTPVSHTDLIHAGNKIEQEPGARELFRNMKDAWRQKRSRDGVKGRKACLFTLKETTKNSLKEMAKDQGVSATELLETLISRSYLAHLRRKKKRGQNTQVMLQEGRHEDLTSIRELFCQDTAQPISLAEHESLNNIETSILGPNSPTEKAVEDADYDIDGINESLTAAQDDPYLPHKQRDNEPATDSHQEGQDLALPTAQATNEPILPSDVYPEKINSSNSTQAATPRPSIKMQRKRTSIPTRIIESIRRTEQEAAAVFDVVDVAKELNDPKARPSE